MSQANEDVTADVLLQCANHETLEADTAEGNVMICSRLEVGVAADEYKLAIAPIIEQKVKIRTMCMPLYRVMMPDGDMSMVDDGMSEAMKQIDRHLDKIIEEIGEIYKRRLQLTSQSADGRIHTFPDCVSHCDPSKIPRDDSNHPLNRLARNETGNGKPKE